MSNEKWDKIDEKFNAQESKERDREEATTTKMNLPTEHAPDDLSSPIPQGTNLNVIQKTKIKSLERKAQLEIVKTATEAKLDVWREKILAEKDLAKKEVVLSYNRELEQINGSYLNDLREIGVVQFEKRAEILLELSKKAARLLAKTESADLPRAMREFNTTQIIDMFKELHSKIATDHVGSNVKKSNK